MLRRCSHDRFYTRSWAMGWCALALLLTSAIGCKERREDASESSIVATSPSASEAATTTQTTTPEPTYQRAPLAWTVSKQGSARMTLLGTIHMGFDAPRRLPPAIWERFDEAPIFAMETDLDSAQADMLARAVLPEGEDLKEILGEQTWGKLDDRLDGTATQYVRLKPWLVMSMLMQQMLPAESASASMDMALLNKARDQKKQIVYLETPDFQLGVIERALTAEQLTELLDEYDEQREELKQMLAAYEQGDAETIERISFDDAPKEPEHYELLFYSRNEAWIGKLDEIASGTQDAFIAFGVGHMFGERGVLKLLEAKGYSVERVKVP